MALGLQPVGKLLDYEQYIEYQLERTQARIKGAEVLNACLVLSTAGLGALFLEVVFDHLIGLPFWVRALTLGAGGALALGFILARIVRPLLSPVNGLYAAKAIEDANPTLQNSLISYLDLRRHGGGGVSTPFLAAVEAKAVNDLLEVDVETVVDLRGLLRTTYALSGIVLIVVIYALFTPRSLLDSVRRALLADVHRPTAVQLKNIKPGDQADLSRVVETATVPFSVEIQGARPDQVVLHYRENGEEEDSTREFAPGQTPFEPWQTTLPEVRQSLDYHITAGDAVSRTYHLEVVPAPIRAVNEILAAKRLPPDAEIEESRALQREEPAINSATKGRRRPFTVERLEKLQRVLEDHHGQRAPLGPSQNIRSVNSKPGQDPPALRADADPTVPPATKTSSAVVVHQAGRPKGTEQGSSPQPPPGQAGRPSTGSGSGSNFDAAANAPENEAATPGPTNAEKTASSSSTPTKPGRRLQQDGDPGPRTPHPKAPNHGPISNRSQPGQPTPGASLKNERPEGGKNERPEGGKNERPEGGKNERPEGGKNERPEGGKNEWPEGGKNERPEGGKNERPEGGKNERPPQPQARSSGLRGKPITSLKNQHFNEQQPEKKFAKSAPSSVKASGGAGQADPTKPAAPRSNSQGIQPDSTSNAVNPPQAKNAREQPTSGKNADKVPPARGEIAPDVRSTNRAGSNGRVGEKEQPEAKAKTKENSKEPEKKQKDSPLLKTQETRQAKRPRSLPDANESPQEPAHEPLPKRDQPRSKSASPPPESGEAPKPGEPGPQQLPSPEAGLPGKTPPGLPSGNPGPAGEKPSQVPHENSTSPGKNPSGRSPKPKSSLTRAPQQPPSASPSPKKAKSPAPLGQSSSRPQGQRPGSAPARSSGRGDGLGSETGPGNGPGSIARGNVDPSGELVPSSSRVPGGRLPSREKASSTPKEGNPQAEAVSPAGRQSTQAGSQSAGPDAPGDRSNAGSDQQLEQPANPTIGASLSPSPQGGASDSRTHRRVPLDTPSLHAGGPANQDQSKPTPHTASPLESAAETVAPDHLPPARSRAEPVVRRLRELIEQDLVSPEVLDAAGVTSKQELDQFVTTLEWELSPDKEPPLGREIEVSQRARETLSVPASLTGLNLKPRGRIDTTRTRSHGEKDKFRGNNEGHRFLVPPELRAGFNAYRTALSRSTRQSP
ncbi:hypothetical protein V5E97_03410 [Singulisphaera sp. Ch08]|uniref:Uncharacterized protein n=1 Tax=Singulisphaera sp. Ch08 TaxID=3120278 RepID=A0AAU7CIT8_9BACT